MSLAIRDGSINSWEARQGVPNEDRTLLDRERQILVIADGHGGQGAAADILIEVVTATAGTDLLAMVEAANTEIFERLSTDSTLRGSATSVVAVAFRGNDASYVHVGDSRIYLLRDGRLERMTTDHVLANEPIPGFPAEMTKAMPRTARTRSIGAKAEVQIDRGVIEIQSGDAVLLCSQGIHKALSDEEIAEALGADQSASDIVKALMTRAGKRQDRFDLSAALLRF